MIDENRVEERWLLFVNVEEVFEKCSFEPCQGGDVAYSVGQVIPKL